MPIFQPSLNKQQKRTRLIDKPIDKTEIEKLQQEYKLPTYPLPIFRAEHFDPISRKLTRRYVTVEEIQRLNANNEIKVIVYLLPVGFFPWYQKAHGTLNETIDKLTWEQLPPESQLTKLREFYDAAWCLPNVYDQINERLGKISPIKSEKTGKLQCTLYLLQKYCKFKNNDFEDFESFLYHLQKIYGDNSQAFIATFVQNFVGKTADETATTLIEDWLQNPLVARIANLIYQELGHKAATYLQDEIQKRHFDYYITRGKELLEPEKDLRAEYNSEVTENLLNLLSDQESILRSTYELESLKHRLALHQAMQKDRQESAEFLKKDVELMQLDKRIECYSKFHSWISINFKFIKQHKTVEIENLSNFILEKPIGEIMRIFKQYKDELNSNPYLNYSQFRQSIQKFKDAFTGMPQPVSVQNQSIFSQSTMEENCAALALSHPSGPI